MCLLIAAVLPLSGCKTDNSPAKADNGDNMSGTGTKSDIEAEIEAHWQEYGYKAKPAKFIAISFDDGPCSAASSGGTEALLAKLDELKVKATFFVIGANVRGYSSVAKAIYDAGHELGNHSDGYGSLGSESSSAVTANLNAASAAIKEITGENPVLFRAPNLNHGDNLSQVCKKLGMALIDGNTHNDWPGSAAAIKNSVISNPQDGGIILLHDNNTSQGNTMSVLPEIVKGLRDKGFWIMTVSQLAAVKEKRLEAGKRYNSIN